MKIQEFLKQVVQPIRLNYLVVCSDELGISLLLQRVFAKDTSVEDTHVFDAESLNKDRARELENEARKAPSGGSTYQIVIVYKLHKLPIESTGPLLKVVEEAKYTRFIFQAQTIPKKIKTLASRSVVVELPFLSRDAVLANMKAMNYDAKTTDELKLYDGTLQGTIQKLQLKDDLVSLRREMAKGLRGISALFYQGETGNTLINSLALLPLLKNKMNKREERFLDRNAGINRKKLVLLLVLGRIEREDG